MRSMALALGRVYRTLVSGIRLLGVAWVRSPITTHWVRESTCGVRFIARYVCASVRIRFSDLRVWVRFSVEIRI
ncbi:hypothetical protein T492DRAFT_933954 [Pavlovales sp. CCMP2436]|nr:hypothetical protein T492DRAFT_933954 [Pavlovales sp. CCMP2436]